MPEIDNRFNPPDWYPQDHPPMPDVVAHGRQPTNFACALCHLTSGGGHPELAGISGLPVGYFMRQMAEFKAGTRQGMRGGVMNQIAKDLSDDDIKAAAEYFGSMKYPVWYKVVEGDGGAEILSRQRRHALPGREWRHRADRQPHHRTAAE